MFGAASKRVHASLGSQSTSKLSGHILPTIKPLWTSSEQRFSPSMQIFQVPIQDLTWAAEENFHFLAVMVPNTCATSSVVYKISLRGEISPKTECWTELCATGSFKSKGRSLWIQFQKGPVGCVRSCEERWNIDGLKDYECNLHLGHAPWRERFDGS